MSSPDSEKTPDILALCEESWQRYCREESLEDTELPQNDLAWSLMLARSKRRGNTGEVAEPGLSDTLATVTGEAEQIETRLRDMFAVLISLDLPAETLDALRRHVFHALGDIGLLVIAVRREANRQRRDVAHQEANDE